MDLYFLFRREQRNPFWLCECIYYPIRDLWQYGNLNIYPWHSFNLGLSLDLCSGKLDVCAFCLRSLLCSSWGKWWISRHAREQQFSYSLEQSGHWINNRWQASFAQLICRSLGLLHWWQLLIISSLIRSPSLASNTKFFPLNLNWLIYWRIFIRCFFCDFLNFTKIINKHTSIFCLYF